MYFYIDRAVNVKFFLKLATFFETTLHVNVVALLLVKCKIKKIGARKSCDFFQTVYVLSSIITLQPISFPQVMYRWLNEGAISDQHQAIDILGFPNPACSDRTMLDEESLTASLNLDLRPDILFGNPNGGPGFLRPELDFPILPSGPDDVAPPPAPQDLFAVGEFLIDFFICIHALVN